MKTTTKLIGFALALSLSYVFPALAKGPAYGSHGLRIQQAVATIQQLGAEEEKTLAWIREEEKLARDAYQTMYTVWKTVVFRNIAASEQRHMDAVLKKLNRFGLPDPALPDLGRFTNPNLQTFYDALIVDSQQSEVKALVMGAKIEDMDIRDLMAAIEATNNLELKITYQNLLEGSKHHLRAFVRLLKNNGFEYSPEYIDQALYEAILEF